MPGHELPCRCRRGVLPSVASRRRVHSATRVRNHGVAAAHRLFLSCAARTMSLLRSCRPWRRRCRPRRGESIHEQRVRRAQDRATRRDRETVELERPATGCYAEQTQGGLPIQGRKPLLAMAPSPSSAACRTWRQACRKVLAWRRISGLRYARDQHESTHNSLDLDHDNRHL